MAIVVGPELTQRREETASAQMAERYVGRGDADAGEDPAQVVAACQTPQDDVGSGAWRAATGVWQECAGIARERPTGALDERRHRVKCWQC